MSENGNKKRIWVDPDIDCNCDCAEDERDDFLRLTYEIPGVDKDKIHLKVIKDAVRLIAHRDDGDYFNEFAFQCEVDTENVKAAYDNGILTVDVTTLCPDPFKEAHAVKIY
ncbi:MAG: Hsp20/alpha crystallin family protein [Spirochaetales bacterium]|nr:Hsp20/alpha crystallin family protein [Spirochaetales bacterium]